MSTLRKVTKAEPQRSGMTHAKWRQVQSIHRKSAGRWLHRGGTYNVGRNEAKRVARAARRAA